jgi:cytochrome c-type biogenesis protein CcmH/NrfG
VSAGECLLIGLVAALMLGAVAVFLWCSYQLWRDGRIK